MAEIKEGTLYKSIIIGKDTFHIYYGYHSDTERAHWEPTPIFPNFINAPMFTADGKPYARADQDVCEHYKPKTYVSDENWCNDCMHFRLHDEILGICHCDKRQCVIRKNE